MAICLMLCLAGCGKHQGDYSSTTNNRFIPISTQQNLYYDTNTKIVYVIFCEKEGIADTGTGYGYMSPYYASNGMPYVYNVEAGRLEEIQWIKQILN